jgi:magnesium transporter
LSIDDCINESPSPKVEEFSPKEEERFPIYLFMVIHAVDYNRKDRIFATGELDFFLGKNFLVTYHTVPLRSISTFEDRCLHSTVLVARAPDRVAHALLDSLVDNYKPALDELSLEIADLENLVLEDSSRETMNRIMQVKKEVLHLRQIIVPQREVLSRFAKGEFKLIRAHLVPYYRDVYNALFHIGELAQSYGDSLSGIMQIYLNVSANQTSQIVKVLTMITLITTPATLIGTWYGMNFKSIAEYDWPHGYIYVTILTVVATALTVLYFRHKKWL